MKKKLIEVSGIPKILGFTSLMLALLFGSASIMVIALLVVEFLKYKEHSALFFLLDNVTFVMGLFILVLPCVYFLKQFFRDFKIGLFLDKIFLSEAGFHIKQKKDLLYKWDKIVAINGKREGWRGYDIVIVFNDGKSIEIPIIDRAKEKTIDFLKELYQKSPQETITNELANKILAS